MTDVIFNVKAGINLVLGQVLAYAAISIKNIFKFCALLPNLHGSRLDDFISSIAGKALFHQFQKDAL